MFQFFHAVEVIYKEEVNQGNLNVGNGFNRIMLKVGKKKLEVIFCCSEPHKLNLILDLVLEFFVIRNHFETKSWKRNDENVAKAKSQKSKTGEVNCYVKKYSHL